MKKFGTIELGIPAYMLYKGVPIGSLTRKTDSIRTKDNKKSIKLIPDTDGKLEIINKGKRNADGALEFGTAEVEIPATVVKRNRLVKTLTAKSQQPTRRKGVQSIRLRGMDDELGKVRIMNKGQEVAIVARILKKLNEAPIPKKDISALKAKFQMAFKRQGFKRAVEQMRDVAKKYAQRQRPESSEEQKEGKYRPEISEEEQARLLEEARRQLEEARKANEEFARRMDKEAKGPKMTEAERKKAIEKAKIALEEANKKAEEARKKREDLEEEARKKTLLESMNKQEDSLSSLKTLVLNWSGNTIEKMREQKDDIKRFEKIFNELMKKAEKEDIGGIMRAMNAFGGTDNQFRLSEINRAVRNYRDFQKPTATALQKSRVKAGMRAIKTNVINYILNSSDWDDLFNNYWKETARALKDETHIRAYGNYVKKKDLDKTEMDNFMKDHTLTQFINDKGDEMRNEFADEDDVIELTMERSVRRELNKEEKDREIFIEKREKRISKKEAKDEKEEAKKKTKKSK